MTSLRAAVLTFLLLSLLGFCALCAPVAKYDTALADVARMAELALTQAPDHQWDAELQQLLRTPSTVGDWSASSAASLVPPVATVLPSPGVDVDTAFE